MRFVMQIGIVVILGTLAFGIWQAVHEGRQMRATELRAAGHTEDLMRAQELHRTREGQPEGGALYGSFRELLEEHLIAGFEPVDEDCTSLRCDGYVFRLTLLPSLDPDDGVVRLGQRYQLWAWPEQAADSALVLYYASNAGYLIQGENGEVTGTTPILPKDNPLRQLDELREKGYTQTRRWTVLKNIRET